MNPARTTGGGQAASPSPRILIVEDDILLRTAISTYLRECGYDVLECGNADEAIRIMQSDSRVDIVLSAVDMAGSEVGFALAQWARRERPEVKVLLTAGLLQTAKTAGDLCEDGPLLAKPYDHGELARRLRALRNH